MLRYCGGCNPQYPRTAFVERLKAELPQLKFCSAREAGTLLPKALVVCGCPRACANTGDLALDTDLLWVTAETQYEAIAQQLSMLLGQQTDDQG